MLLQLTFNDINHFNQAVSLFDINGWDCETQTDNLICTFSVADESDADNLEEYLTDEMDNEGIDFKHFILEEN